MQRRTSAWQAALHITASNSHATPDRDLVAHSNCYSHFSQPVAARRFSAPPEQLVQRQSSPTRVNQVWGSGSNTHTHTHTMAHATECDSSHCSACTQVKSSCQLRSCRILQCTAHAYCLFFFDNVHTRPAGCAVELAAGGHCNVEMYSQAKEARWGCSLIRWPSCVGVQHTQFVTCCPNAMLAWMTDSK